MHRFALIASLLLLFLLPSTQLVAQEGPVEPTKQPLLWRIEGETPSYLFGTIHLPDPRVTTLHPAVIAALKEADEVYTEIRLDGAGMVAMAKGASLPAGETLTQLLPKDLYDRLNKEFTRINPMLNLKLMDRQKIWVATNAPILLEQQFKNPGKVSLDQSIWKRASDAGKKVDGIETLEEQLGVFDTLSTDEQIQMLRETLDALDLAREQNIDPVEQLIELYLSGKTDSYREAFFQFSGKENPLMVKLYDALLTKRNERMADRIHAHISADASVSRFYAIGAAHYGDDDGIGMLLEAKGLKVTRVVPLEK